ncbi:MAG: hypothetical protein JWR80_9512 [Bradyrhizobium sp.]|nr:hypothetical protein [Bradyrhizobium sp.]
MMRAQILIANAYLALNTLSEKDRVMTQPAELAEQQLLSEMAKALYEQFADDDFMNTYAGWDLLPAKDEWIERAEAAYAPLKSRIEALEGLLRDARTTLVKTATGHIGSDEMSLPRSMFDSVVRNLDAARATLSVEFPK